MISFVIPAYNAEKTIKRAIDSILNQEETTLFYEIIVVNDGSKDNTEDVMKQFEQNEKIKYFVKENTGVADTRNYGVSKASGEYIIFVDCDDYVDTHLLKDIEQYIKQNIDLIKWQAKIVYDNKDEINLPNRVSFKRCYRGRWI